jgi:hypothetical protein
MVEGFDRCKTNNDTPTPRLNSLSLQDTIRHHQTQYVESHWALFHLSTTDNTKDLLQDFKDGKALMVGDGSYDDISGYGAGAFICSSADMTQFIIAGGPTPGNQECQNPYRSELGTILGMAILANILATVTNCSPSITVACDNDQALIRSFRTSIEEIKAHHQSCDLLSTIHDLWSSTSINLVPSFVRGHADSLGRELTTIEQLNVIVDHKAKEFLHIRQSKDEHRQYDEKFGMPQVTLQDNHISGSIAKSLQEAHQKLRSLKAGLRLGRFTEESWELIDHIALKRAMHSSSHHKRLFITKWVSHQLPVAKRMKERKQFVQDKCPICCQQTEDISHLLRCQNDEALSFYQQQLNQLRSWGERVQTDPSILHSLLLVLQLKRMGHNDLHRLFPCILTKARHHSVFKHQSRIGWDAFLEGLISTEWARLQQDYYKSIQCQGSGKSWASGLIQQLWNINHQVWNYRNRVLHENQQKLNTLYGVEELDKAIRWEFLKGLDELNTKFSFLFTKYSVERVMKLPSEQKMAKIFFWVFDEKS